MMNANVQYQWVMFRMVPTKKPLSSISTSLQGRHIHLVLAHSHFVAQVHVSPGHSSNHVDKRMGYETKQAAEPPQKKVVVI